MKLNSDRLKEYKSRLVVFPRKSGSKKGDASSEELSHATQLKGQIIPFSKIGDAVSYTALDEDMKKFNAHSALRVALNEAKLVGIRLKKAQSGDKDEKPAGGKGGGDDDA